MRPYLIAALLCVAAAPLLAAEPGSSLPARTTSAGGVTVKATPRTLSGAVWEFELVFDTHTQALNDDPARQASLHGDGGAGIAAKEWRGDAPGSHHRVGLLRFDAPAPKPAAIELRLPRTGESSPRVFRWQLR